MAVSVETRPVALGVFDVEKSFGGTHAVDGVSFEVACGSIHALLGGNGSGKSTTIKMLSGNYRADGGQIQVRAPGGDDVRTAASAWTPALAKEAGLRFVHQQTTTFPELTVAENLAAGHGFETDRLGRVRWRAQRRRAAAVLARFGLDIDPAAPLASYGVAMHAMVAVARAMQDVEMGDDSHPGVLVLDEPTAALPPEEVTFLLGELRRLADLGLSVLYVTHRLDEVVEIADRATVLRDGRVAGTISAPDIDHSGLIELITGGQLAAVTPAASAPRRDGAPRLSLDAVVGGAVRQASLEVMPGEVVGVAGLLGSGRSTLLRMASGDASVESGAMEIDGQPFAGSGPREAIRAGVAYVPEDRRGSAAFMELSVRENIGIIAASRHFRRARFRHRSEITETQQLLRTYCVRAASTEMPIGLLSGGNQQKALIGRWLRLEPRLLLLDEPSQGVDVGARAEIWQLIREATDRGAGALVVSSDFDELATFCDRIVIVTQGRTRDEISCAGLTDQALESAVLATGGKAE